MKRFVAIVVGCALFLFLAGSVTGALPGRFGPAEVRAASPQPSSGVGDTRSVGEAPGFVGAPLVAIGAVLGLGALAALVTIVYVRLTGGPGRDHDGAPAPPR